MKKYIVTLIALLCINICFAQDKNILAKIAFEDAETAYAAGNVLEAINELVKVDSLLGKKTPKSQYLWVQVWLLAAEEHPSNIDGAIKFCKDYLNLSKSFDIPEEKVMDVTRTIVKLEKSKLTLKTQLADAKEKAQKEAKEKILIEGAINAYEKNLDFPLGSSLSDLKAKHPDFAKAIAGKDRGYEKSFTKARVLGGTKIFLYKEMILSFNHDVLEQIKVEKFLFNYSDDLAGVKGKAKLVLFLEDFIFKHGLTLNPFIQETSGFHSELYILEAGEKKLTLYYINDYGSNLSTCFLSFDAKMNK